MINKELIKESFKGIVSDRPILLLVLGQLILSIIYILVISFSIHVSDVTVYTRYTAFGEAHFYKSPWQYLLLFVAFGGVVAAVHIGILAKMHQIGRRQSAIFTGCMGIIVTILALVYALAVISLGRAA